MLTEELEVLLRAKYAPPEYALLFNVADGTDSSVYRRADAIAMGVWPSRGLLLEGFELKVSRRDWLREKKNPAKAESIGKYCDRWWIVAGDDSIVLDGELPATWGLMVPHAKGLKVKVPANDREPEPVNRLFLAAMMRKVVDGHYAASQVELDARYRDGYAAAQKSAERHESSVKQHLEYELKHLKAAVAAFEMASGVKISGWNAGQVGEAVKAVLSGNLDPVRLREMRSVADEIIKSIDRYSNDAKQVNEQPPTKPARRVG